MLTNHTTHLQHPTSLNMVARHLRVQRVNQATTLIWAKSVVVIKIHNKIVREDVIVIASRNHQRL